MHSVQSSACKVTWHRHVCRQFIVQFLRSRKQHVKRMGNEIRTDPGTVFPKLTVNQRNEREAEFNRIRLRANICLTHYSLSTLSALERLKCRCHYSKRTPNSKLLWLTPLPQFTISQDNRQRCHQKHISGAIQISFLKIELQINESHLYFIYLRNRAFSLYANWF